MQDDFLDLADDDHHADMALCLANGQPQTVVHSSTVTNHIPSGAVMKTEAESNGLAVSMGTAASNTTNNVNHHHLIDNPAMKLDNLDNWDQDV